MQTSKFSWKVRWLWGGGRSKPTNRSISVSARLETTPRTCLPARVLEGVKKESCRRTNRHGGGWVWTGGREEGERESINCMYRKKVEGIEDFFIKNCFVECICCRNACMHHSLVAFDANRDRRTWEYACRIVWAKEAEQLIVNGALDGEMWRSRCRCRCECGCEWTVREATATGERVCCATPPWLCHS